MKCNQEWTIINDKILISEEGLSVKLRKSFRQMQLYKIFCDIYQLKNL